jgi:hypothetical protein
MDGRTQEPLIEWMKRRFDAEYVDMITEPGPDRIVAWGSLSAINAIKEKVLISVRKHGSAIVAVAGHDDCAGNPAPKQEHVEQIKEAVERIVSWDLGVRAYGLWINERWRVEVICDSGRSKSK